MNDIRRLYLSRTNKVIAGVCGGLGEYFGIDPVILRVIAVVLVFAHGIGLIGYFIAWLVMPKRPAETVSTPASSSTASPTPTPTLTVLPAPVHDSTSWGRYLPGAILILVGLYFLLDRHFWWWHIERFWPVLLVIAGAVLIVHYFRKNSTHKEGINEPSQI
jgi:phage shock protein C